MSQNAKTHFSWPGINDRRSTGGQDHNSNHFGNHQQKTKCVLPQHGERVVSLGSRRYESVVLTSGSDTISLWSGVYCSGLWVAVL